MNEGNIHFFNKALTNVKGMQNNALLKKSK